MSAALGDLETQLVAYVQLRRLSSVRTGDLTGPLGITPTQERELLSRLVRRGLIARVRRGLYLVPPRFPPGGKWSLGVINSILKNPIYKGDLVYNKTAKGTWVRKELGSKRSKQRDKAEWVVLPGAVPSIVEPAVF